MKKQNAPYPTSVNLENCAKEPIHIIGNTQEFGLLLVADLYTFKIVQTGNNTFQFLSREPKDLLGKDLGEILGKTVVSQYKVQLEEQEKLSTQDLRIEDKDFLLMANISEGHLLLDLEPLKEADPVQGEAKNIFMDFKQRGFSEDIFQKTTRLAKKYFGYDRVMIYKFDEEWNGEVVAEAREPEMQSWYGLHYPASDIPEQSRAMFLKNGLRMISDVNYTPVPIQPGLSPVTKTTLNISLSSLRAVSPIHIEYLKNMGVGASLTAAIEVKGKLWGLMACHHRIPKFLNFYNRESCLFLARMLAMELAIAETDTYIQKGSQMEQKREQLVQQIRAFQDVPKGLCEGQVKFTDLFPCGGGALYVNGKWNYLGNHPAPEDLQELLKIFLISCKETLYYTETLGKVFPEAEKYKEVASGLLSLRLAENKYLLWFRPEALQTVEWGGDPNNKVFYNQEEQRLSPRKSFEKWTELKQGTSLPWKDYDFNAAKALAENLSYEFLARQRNEIEALNTELSEANKELELFSYGLSHDLKAPIRGIEGLLDIILEEHVENIDPQGLNYLERIAKLSKKLELLIEDILAYSRMSHSRNLKLEDIDTEELLEEVMEFISAKAQYPLARILLQEGLPRIFGDRKMLVQVWSNLLNNALKYSRRTANPTVKIGSTIQGGKQIYFVKDNGIGIPENLRESIFEPFKRAVGSDFEGSGIGLALVQKIVDKHGGEIWVESEPGESSIFYLYLPAKKENS